MQRHNKKKAERSEYVCVCAVSFIRIYSDCVCAFFVLSSLHSLALLSLSIFLAAQLCLMFTFMHGNEEYVLVVFAVTVVDSFFSHLFTHPRHCQSNWLHGISARFVIIEQKHPIPTVYVCHVLHFIPRKLYRGTKKCGEKFFPLRFYIAIFLWLL